MLDLFLDLELRDMIIAYILIFFVMYIVMIPFVTEVATPEGGKVMAPRKLVYVCLVHSTMAVFGSCYVLYNTDPGADPMALVPVGSKPFLRCTLGYLVFDVLFMVWNRSNVPLESTVMVHHANTFLAIFLADYNDVGLYFCGFLALNEASSIPMHIMRLTSSRKLKSVLKIVFALSFLTFRTIMLPVLLYYMEKYYINNSSVDMAVIQMERKSFYLHLVINWYWTYMVIKMAMKSKAVKSKEK
jgi:hypothetical protein